MFNNIINHHEMIIQNFAQKMKNHLYSSVVQSHQIWLFHIHIMRVGHGPAGTSLGPPLNTIVIVHFKGD